MEAELRKETGDPIFWGVALLNARQGTFKPEPVS